MTSKNKIDKPEPPVKPVSGYLKFAHALFKELKGQPNVRDKVKGAWNALTEAERTEFNDEFKEKLDIYKKDKEAYEEKYGQVASKKERKSATK